MGKIMIVDDQEDICLTLQTLVEKEGHSTSLCNTGGEFLNKVKEFSPDLVFLDVMMPGLTTREILSELKRRKVDDLKIILITVVRFSDEELMELMKDPNLVAYMPKPFDVQELVDLVKTHLEG